MSKRWHYDKQRLNKISNSKSVALSQLTMRNWHDVAKMLGNIDIFSSDSRTVDVL